MSTTPVAHLYSRFSSREQAKGGSLERQAMMAESWSAKNGIPIKSTYSDHGVSAFDGSNIEGELGVFLEAIKSGDVKSGDYLLIEALDRLTRLQPMQALDLFRRVVDKGVKVVFMTTGRIIDGSSINALDSIFTVIMDAHVANAASATKSRYGLAHWQKVRSKGLAHHKPPFWLERTESGWKPIPDKVKVVQEIFKKSIEGKGADAIAKDLRDQGIPTTYGPAWSGPVITRLLSGRRVLGEFSYTWTQNGKVERTKIDPNFYPAIISEDTWELSRTKVEGRTVEKINGPTERFYALGNSFAKCGKCGASIVISDCPSYGGVRVRKYRCSASKNGLCTVKNGWPTIQADKNFVCLMASHGVRILKSNSSDITAIETKIKRLEQSKEKLLAAFKKTKDDSFIEHSEMVADEIKELRKTLESHNNSLGSLDLKPMVSMEPVFIRRLRERISAMGGEVKLYLDGNQEELIKYHEEEQEVINQNPKFRIIEVSFKKQHLTALVYHKDKETIFDIQSTGEGP